MIVSGQKRDWERRDNSEFIIAASALQKLL